MALGLGGTPWGSLEGNGGQCRAVQGSGRLVESTGTLWGSVEGIGTRWDLVDLLGVVGEQWRAVEGRGVQWSAVKG